MGIREDFLPYTDRLGFVSGSINPEPYHNDNGLRFTSEYYIALKQNKELVYDDVLKWREIIASCEVEPGLLRRHPHSFDYEAIDDYQAVIACAALVAPDIANRILFYGEKNCFVYNNVDPGKFRLGSYFGRFPTLIACMSWAACKRPWLLEREFFHLTLRTVDWWHKDDRQDKWALSYLALLSADQTDEKVRKTREIWLKKLQAVYPGGIPQVLGEYFGNPNHPLAKYYGLDTVRP